MSERLVTTGYCSTIEDGHFLLVSVVHSPDSFSTVTCGGEVLECLGEMEDDDADDMPGGLSMIEIYDDNE